MITLTDILRNTRFLDEYPENIKTKKPTWKPKIDSLPAEEERNMIPKVDKKHTTMKKETETEKTIINRLRKQLNRKNHTIHKDKTFGGYMITDLNGNCVVSGSPPNTMGIEAIKNWIQKYL